MNNPVLIGPFMFHNITIVVFIPAIVCFILCIVLNSSGTRENQILLMCVKV
jgi:hypothetical protein